MKTLQLQVIVVFIGLVGFLSFSESVHRDIQQLYKPVKFKLAAAAAGVDKNDSGRVGGEDQKTAQRIQSMINQFSAIITKATSAVNLVSAVVSKLVGNISNGAQGGISSLLENPDQKLATLLDKMVTPGDGAGCKPKDPWLLANIPGIYVGVPLVIIGVSILVGCVAAITVAIGGLGSDITESILEHMKNKYQSDDDGYESSYGSHMSMNSYDPVTTSPSSDSNSRLDGTVNTALGNWSEVYDKHRTFSLPPSLQLHLPSNELNKVQHPYYRGTAKIKRRR